ncbi:glycerate kinase [Demequina zhanjiangensis]|uniref:Glycerate kinase n=1 Tax=Demequina zhanjiangensis TaxID=3051659 RepID=A0ABT8FXE5_9MICO|nr:glycerate kinase [Demequina sp. SYSU T00b26]MDN4471570.1 glycerate kinase [Demequina sp. SYSU T00b26]
MTQDGARGRRGPLRVVVALDSFKGSVSSAEACAAAREGVLAVSPEADVAVVPVADGGEGTLAALEPYGSRGSTPSIDLLGRSTLAPYVVLGDTVAVESAHTVGLPLLGEPTPERARTAHSFGLGLHLRGAARLTESHRALVGLGGTGVTDGGVGMLLALGAHVWTESGEPLWPDGRPHGTNPLLLHPTRVTLPQLECTPVGLADVASPLLGPRGAARMFGPQKGADAALVDELESAMEVWAQALSDAGAEVAGTPGAGAAGGLGAAVLAIGGSLAPGLETLLRETDSEQRFASADLVLTGEGALDSQTSEGKVPAAVAKVAHRLASGAGTRTSVVAIAGRVDADADALALMGLHDALPLHDPPLPLPDALDRDVTLAAISRAAARAVSAHLAAG